MAESKDKKKKKKPSNPFSVFFGLDTITSRKKKNDDAIKDAS